MKTVDSSLCELFCVIGILYLGRHIAVVVFSINVVGGDRNLSNRYLKTSVNKIYFCNMREQTLPLIKKQITLFFFLLFLKVLLAYSTYTHTATIFSMYCLTVFAEDI